MSVHTSIEERIEIMERCEKGEAVWRISRSLGWRGPTVRKWQNRARQQGRAGLVSHMGRPKRGALSSFATEIREAIVRWRSQHPGWGPATLQAELARHPSLCGQKIPSTASISRFLQEHGFSQPREKHSPLPSGEQQPPGLPHAVWEMDARGYQYVPDVGVVTLINLNDASPMCVC